MITHHAVKFNGHRYCISGDVLRPRDQRVLLLNGLDLSR